MTASKTLQNILTASLVFLIFLFSIVSLKATKLASTALSYNEEKFIENKKDASFDVAKQPDVVVNSSVKAFKEPDIGKPIKIYIPKINLTVDIADGYYSHGEWTLSDDKAYYATITPKLNAEKGQTVIYGHNTPRIFYNTKELQNNDTLLVYTDSGKVAEYIYHSHELVLPTNSEIFNYDGKYRLTLLTCNGWLNGRLDEYRKLLYFDFNKIVQS